MLDGKVVIVTGAARGIGQEYTRACANAGAKSFESRNAFPPVSADKVVNVSCEAKLALKLFWIAPPLNPPVPRKLAVEASPSGAIACNPRVSSE